MHWSTSRSNTSFLFLLSVLLVGLLAGCSSYDKDIDYSNVTPCHATFAKRAYNKPYEIRGDVHVPQTYYEYAETGVASYYGGRDIFHGRPTSNGEIFNKNHITAAHKTLPIPCVVRIVNLENNRSLLVKVNDRGPFIKGRIVDVSERVAKILGFYQQGLARVRVETDVASSIKLANAMDHSLKARLKQKRKLRQFSDPALRVATFTVKDTARRKRESQPSVVLKPVFIDAGGFYQSNKARLFARRLQARGASVQIRNVKMASNSFFRVLVGPYDSVQAAYNALKELNSPDLQAAKVIKL